jgi:hypothetical protein
MDQLCLVAPTPSPSWCLGTFRAHWAELLVAFAITTRSFNSGHVRHVHRSELRMEPAHGLRRPVGRALPLPAAGAGDAPAGL